MMISLNLLKQYVHLPTTITSDEVASRLILSTVEVESIKKQAEFLDGIVVGEILDIKKHPNADKLSIAQVDVGEAKPRQIIFGQMVTMEVGFKIPVALAPTTLPGNKKIEKAKMRGEVSEGMLCLDQELGLLKEGVSIHFFDKKVKPGTPIIKALGLDDVIFEIDNKSMTNRPDLWGHYGMAREAAAIFDKKLIEYNPPVIKAGKKIKIAIKNEDVKLCPRYMAAAIEGVKIAPSPDWMQKRLLAVGLRPINNIVDITNFVMLDLGQPMHAFDATKLYNRQPTTDNRQVNIVVRRAKEGERFTTLDDNEHILCSSDLLIATAEKAVALAGVMGGMESGISGETTTIVFESANFDPTNTRKTATRLGARTDSSARFEKSLDPNLCAPAIRRAVELVLEFCPGAKVASNVADESHFHLFTGPLEVSVETLRNKIGVEISVKIMVDILQRLGFGVKVKGKLLSVKIPTWRATKDISIAEDLVEEIARIYGYNNIPVAMPLFPIIPPEENKLRKFEHLARNVLVKELAYSEVYNYSFVSPADIAKLGDDQSKYIELDNPVAKDRPYVRRNLVINLLGNILSNIDNYQQLRLFEIGKTFLIEKNGARVKANSDELLPRQDSWVTAIFVDKKNNAPYWEARRALEEISSEFNLGWKPEETKDKQPWMHPVRSMTAVAGKEVFGSVYELHPHAAEQWGIDSRVGVMELNLSKVADLELAIRKYQSLSTYPDVERDIALVVKRDVPHRDISYTILHIDQLIIKTELFDVYEGANISDGYKSMAYHLVYRDPEKTLTAEEVDRVQEKVMKALKEKFGAEARR